MSTSGLTPLPDPGGVQEAVDRYRDLAKYLIAILAAVGGALVAGVQLSSIGKLSWNSEPGHVIAAVAGFAVAITAVIRIVTIALDILRPIEMSLDDVAADAELKADVEQLLQPSGVSSVEALEAILEAPGMSDDERGRWEEIRQAAVGRAAYVVAGGRFERAWQEMRVGGAVAVLGIVAFAWGANPPEKAPADHPVTTSSPARVAVVFTPTGRRLVGEVAGPSCAPPSLHALAIAGNRAEPEIVTVPRSDCRSIRMTLEPELGRALPLHAGWAETKPAARAEP